MVSLLIVDGWLFILFTLLLFTWFECLLGLCLFCLGLNLFCDLMYLLVVSLLLICFVFPGACCLLFIWCYAGVWCDCGLFDRSVGFGVWYLFGFFVVGFCGLLFCL